MNKLLPPLLLVFSAILSVSIAESGVHILSENLEQMVTSTTLKWISSDKSVKEYVNGVIGAYEVEQDATIDDNDTPNSIKKPVYVCRGRQNGLWLSGHLRTTDHKCLVTHYGNVYKLDRYDVLINTEDSARLSWVHRDKYTLDPPGAVAAGIDTFKNFVARTSPMGGEDGKETSRILGKLDTTVNFGKYTFVDKDNKQFESEDGEILVETEPIRYELKHVKYERTKKPQPKDELILGQTVLKNEESMDVSTVETIISYNYTYKLNWGHGHGLLIGLPFDVHEIDGNVTKHKWGIPETRQAIRTFPIRYYLPPGTAVNVTLRGDYVDGEYPYTATMISHYKDLGTHDRLIKDNKRETTMMNVISEFGSVYFLKNNSFVPTTTTTTTTTTTATTTKKTTTATEPLPINPPEIDEDDAVTKKVKGAESGKKHENNSMMSDDGDALSLQKKTSGHSPSIAVFSNGFLISTVVMVLRLT